MAFTTCQSQHWILPKPVTPRSAITLPPRDDLKSIVLIFAMGKNNSLRRTTIIKLVHVQFAHAIRCRCVISSLQKWTVTLVKLIRFWHKNDEMDEINRQLFGNGARTLWWRLPAPRTGRFWWWWLLLWLWCTWWWRSLLSRSLPCRAEFEPVYRLNPFCISFCRFLPTLPRLPRWARLRRAEMRTLGLNSNKTNSTFRA